MYWWLTRVLSSKLSDYNWLVFKMLSKEMVADSFCGHALAMLNDELYVFSYDVMQCLGNGGWKSVIRPRHSIFWNPYEKNGEFLRAPIGWWRSRSDFGHRQFMVEARAFERRSSPSSLWSPCAWISKYCLLLWTIMNHTSYACVWPPLAGGWLMI